MTRAPSPDQHAAPLRVLMFGWEFPPHLSGGLGTACHGLAHGLVGLGVDVTFVLPRLRGGEDSRAVTMLGASATAGWGDALVVAVDSPLVPYLREDGYRQRRREALAGRGPTAFDPSGGRAVVAARGAAGGDPYGPDLLSEVSRYARAGAEVARARGPDVVHAHDWMAFPAGLAAARATGAPLVLHVHAMEHDRCPTRPDPRIVELERGALVAADRVVAVSRYEADLLRRRYRIPASRLRVVHNAAPRTRPARRARRPRGAPPVVLFLGRMTAQKGPRTFLEMASRVVRAVPRARFLMAGSGDLFAETVERAASMGMGDRVAFAGFLGGRDVGRAYRMADVFVMPSVSEPFGIAPLEALAHGVPVVLSRRSGVVEVVPSAPTAEPRDAAGFARHVVSLLRRPALRRRLVASGQREASRVRWGRQARLLREVYREAMA